MSSTPATDALLDAFAPWLAYDANGDLQGYLRALGAMFDPVAVLVTDQGFPDATDGSYVPGWSLLLDPDNCPARFLPFLSMFNGTGVKPGTVEATARAQIKAEAGFARGTSLAIIAVAQQLLIGTKYCKLIERRSQAGGADAYQAGLVMRPSECPSLAAVKAAVNAVKPGGIVFWFVLTDGFIWNQATGTWNADTMAWDATATVQP